MQLLTKWMYRPMELLQRIKKLASILLLICLLLPLSQCSGPSKNGQEIITVHYGYQMLANPAKEIFNDCADWDLLFVIFIYLAFFFAPLISLALKTPIQQIVTIAFAFPAGYASFIHFFIMTPRIGIWLATLLWLMLVTVCFIELYKAIILQRQKAREINIPDNE